MYMKESQIENNKSIAASFISCPPQLNSGSFMEKFQEAIQQKKTDENPFSLFKRNDIDVLIIKINHVTVTVNEAKKLKELLAISIKKENRNFIIDLSNTHVIDSTFLGAVILGLKKINQIGGKLAVVADPMKLKILHSFTELYKVLNIQSTLDSAVKEFI